MAGETKALVLRNFVRHDIPGLKRRPPANRRSLMPPPSLFFEASRSVNQHLSDLCNFVWASAVGMWNLRQQVDAYFNDRGDRTEGELHERFVEGSGVTSADLRTSCRKWTWEQTQEQIARVLLFELCALLEGWL